MKLSLLALFVFVFSFGAFAQRWRGGRPRHVDVNHGPVIRYPRGGGPVIVGPRYNPPGCRRVVRNVYRTTPVWTAFGFSCNYSNTLLNNGFIVHDFAFAQDCSLAINDIRRTTDFCDGSYLYDQSGILQGTFSSNYECRQALGWYY